MPWRKRTGIAQALVLLASCLPNTAAASEAGKVFEQRILPILNASKPSSCTECHLSGVDLKDYINADQKKTFASLVNAGLINTKAPDDSKILAFIRRKPEKPSLITEQVRQMEFEGFRDWIRAAVREPSLLEAEADPKLGPTVSNELIRHARRDRVLSSFVDNVWTEVGRCAGCHSPDQNQKQVEEHGAQVSWITLGNPRATMDYMLEAELVNIADPANSLLLLKPTMQVEHGGGQKMLLGDRTYQQFRRFIDDYSAIVRGKYRSSEELPQPADEVSVATSMADGIWFKLTDVPAQYDQKLLQVDIYSRDGDRWSETRCATADRAIFGKGQLWQQTLSLTAARGSKRADEIVRRQSLPNGEYLVKVYIDKRDKLGRDSQSELGQEEFVGQVVVKSDWQTGYGKMTVTRFP